MNAKIFIDPGHGGDSIGAVYKGRKEQDDCLRMALAVKSLLLTQKGIEVLMSRETDINPSITARAKQANEWGAAYFLSIHRNAANGNANGVEVWIFSKCEIGGETYQKAKNIVDSVCEKTPFGNRGVKLGAPNYVDFGVNRLTTMHSCLLELGFIDSVSDNAVFDAYFSETALAIAESAMSAVGLQYEPPIVKGDVDGDGKVTSTDARLILRASVGLEKIDLERADIDGDGKITASDAREAMRKSVGL